ncbi:MAG: mobile mystery protein A [Pseudomonadales bacterium]|nr:mobile mystery protein A [Pseudomonadales bacterium]
MRAQERALARKHLDKKLSPLRDSKALLRPPKGWVKALRDALGMTAEQLARRIGVTKPRVYEIERAELNGSITLDSLERAAQAMDCQLVYALIPRQPLQSTVEQRALLEAKKRMRAAAHTMILEDQAVEEPELRQQVDALAKELLSQKGSILWGEK